MKRARIVSVVVTALLLGACSTQATQEDNNTAGVSSPTAQITEDATDIGGSSDAAGGSNDTTGGEDGNTATGSGGDNNATANGTDDNGTTTPAATPKSLKLTVTKTSLNKDHNTTLTLTGTYADGTRKDLSAQARWLVTPKDAIKITGHTLTALKDVNVTLRAQVGKVLSNPVHLEIYWEVNGHRLPPEPDPKVNNATLLGVDVNHNGVRDDVERWIYEKYPVRLHRALLISKAKFFQMVLITPLSDAKKLAEENTKNINCELYLGDIDDAIESDDWLGNEEVLKNMIFNTKERVRKYLDYNLALSGGVYGSSPKNWNRDACSEEIRRVLEEMGK